MKTNTKPAKKKKDKIHYIYAILKQLNHIIAQNFTGQEKTRTWKQ